MHGDSVPQRQPVSLSYEGLLPTSGEFAGYERALPGAAERILAQVEKEADHRRENNSKLSLFQNPVSFERASITLR
jgi:uncharacterized membrane protein